MPARKKQTDKVEPTPKGKNTIEQTSENVNENKGMTSSNTKSLTVSLQRTKKKPVRVRFTLDLDKALDSRLSKAGTRLNRSKADLTRIALEMLLDQLEKEWDN